MWKRRRTLEKRNTSLSPHPSGLHQFTTFQRQMYGMPTLCRSLPEPGLASNGAGIRFGVSTETTFSLYQQLLQLRMYGLFRCMSHWSDQAIDCRNKENDPGRYRYFLQRPLRRKHRRTRLRCLRRTLSHASSPHGPLQRNTDNPACQPRPLYRMRWMRIDLPGTSDACHHRQTEHTT